MQRRGFTLIELLVTISLALVLFTISAVSMRTSIDKAGARSAAAVLAEGLRAARQRATALGQPVGVAFPSQGGTVSICQSWYLLEGQQPRIARVVDLRGDFPTSAIFVGTWGSGFGGDLPGLGSVSDAFQPLDWGLAADGDPTLVFTPQGTVKTNNIKLWQGQFALVVGEGIEYQGGGAAATGILVRAGHPQTVLVSPLGLVEVREGVPGAEPTVVSDHAFPLPPLATPPPLPGKPTRAPQFAQAPQAIPDPAQLKKPAASQDDFVTLCVNAVSPEKVPLYCRWQDRPESGAPGVFARVSASGAGLSDAEMTYDAADKVWTCTWHWRPPPQAEGTFHRLVCRVFDEWGNQVESDVNALRLGVTRPQKRLNFAGVRNHVLSLYSINEDGTGLRAVAPNVVDNTLALRSFNIGRAHWSDDGERLAYVSPTEGLCVVESDGTAKRVVVSDTSIAYPLWAPNNSQLAYAQGGDMWICDADGSNRVNISSPLRLIHLPIPIISAIPDYHANDGLLRDWPDGYAPSNWAPGADRVVFYLEDRFFRGVATVVSQVAPPNHFWFLLYATVVSFSPDGQDVVFCDPGGTLFRARADGTNQVAICGDACDARWSPSGNKIAFYSLSQHNVWLVDASPGSVPQQFSTGYEDRIPYWIWPNELSFFRHSQIAPVAPGSSRGNWAHYLDHGRDRWVTGRGDIWLGDPTDPTKLFNLTRDGSAACFYGWTPRGNGP